MRVNNAQSLWRVTAAEKVSRARLGKGVAFRRENPELRERDLKCDSAEKSKG